jgi:hypothetical protein
LLNNYNATHHRALIMDDVKQRFLTNPPSIEVLFLFTYTLARLLNIADEPPHLRTNAFAGQLELNLFFDTALVIEAVIAEKNPTKKRPDGRDMTFFDQALHLLARGGHPLAGPQLGEINGQFNANFNQAIQEALDGTIALKTGILEPVGPHCWRRASYLRPPREFLRVLGYQQLTNWQRQLAGKVWLLR